jgi:hypothetical protein
MESLAIAAAILVLITVAGGPISLLIAVLSKRISKKYSVFFTLLFGVPAVLVGIYLISLNIGIGARLMGLFGLITSSVAIAKVITR